MGIKSNIGAICTCLTVLSFNTNAAIINIDSVNNNTLNPVSIFFDAGTHVLDPIGVIDGGNYNSLSAGAGTGGRVGSWLWRYSISSSELGIINVNWLPPYSATEMDAFATAISTSFTLTSGAFVDFYIYDGPNGYEYSGDNFGGVSLEVGAVPIPAAVWLFGSGLIGLIGIARRKKHND